MFILTVTGPSQTRSILSADTAEALRTVMSDDLGMRPLGTDEWSAPNRDYTYRIVKEG